MLTSPSPSATVPTANQQQGQLLSTPNTQSIRSMQQSQKMGIPHPGPFAIAPSAGGGPMLPHGGMATQVPGLSSNPLQPNPMAAMIAALQGQGQH